MLKSYSLSTVTLPDVTQHYFCAVPAQEKEYSKTKASGLFLKPISVVSGRPVLLLNIMLRGKMLVMNITYIANTMPPQFSFVNVLSLAWCYLIAGLKTSDCFFLKFE